MGTSLAFHLTFAILGVGLPVMMLAAEGLHLRTGDPTWRALARRWSKAFAILFAVGAVSGTIISFELGLLWPRFTDVAGRIIGLPFSLEGFAFFSRRSSSASTSTAGTGSRRARTSSPASRSRSPGSPRPSSSSRRTRG
jgi:cytochrome bd-type quinol oxidase subunit 1